MYLRYLWLMLLLSTMWVTGPVRADAGLTIQSPPRIAYLLSFWLVDFRRDHPGVETRLELGDASASVDALIQGRTTLVMMARPLTDEETGAFRARYGYRPAVLRVAHDALRVYVHRSNPLVGIDVARLDALYSVTRHCGWPENIFWWDQLGLDGDWRLRQVELYGPHAGSEARGAFAAKALCRGRHKATLEMAATPRDLMSLVARNPAAIAYGYSPAVDKGVRELPVSERAGRPYVGVSPESVRSRRYPLVHDVYAYLNRQPDQAVAAHPAALLRLILSPAGQARAASNGFVPLEPGEAAAELARLR